RERTAAEEALVEGLAHVADLVELLPVPTRAERGVVGVERAGPAHDLAAPQRVERRLRREAARLDRVVDALEPVHVDETRALSAEPPPGRVEAGRQRVLAALGDRLRPPRDALAATEDLPYEPVRLELLQDVVDGELDVRGLESGHEADCDEVVAHGVDERPAELAEARRRAQRPAHR